MKIKEIQIENYRSIKKLNLKFPIEGILSLVGPNNAGKSNILRAINNIIGESWWNKDKAELNDFYNKNKSQPIKIKIIFDNSHVFEFNSSKDWPTYKDARGNDIKPWKIPQNCISKGSVKEDFPCTYLEANRNIENSLQFKTWTLMGKIARSFNDIAQTKKTEIETEFNRVMTIFESIPEFKNFKEDFVIFFNELQADSPYKLKVDFKAFTPLNYFKSISILANDSSINNEYDTDIVELGEGNKNLILFALVRSYAKNFKQDAQGILAIEEPEIYMHPQAQKHLYSIFKEIVKDSNIQIIFSTHSPCFVATEDFYQIGIVSKSKEEGTKVKMVSKEEIVNFCINTGVPTTKTDISNISEFYSTTSNYRLNESFFSKFSILVEGDTEELALPVYMNKIGINCDTRGISIIGVGGKNQIPKYWRLFYSFGIPLLVIFDNDNSSQDKQKCNQNVASCFNCTINSIADDVDILKELNSEKNDNGEYTFKQKIIILENNFETSIMKDLNVYCQTNTMENKYAAFEDEAKKVIKPLNNSQKGQIARFIAKKIVKEYPSFIPSIITKIKDAIPQEVLNCN